MVSNCLGLCNKCTCVYGLHIAPLNSEFQPPNPKQGFVHRIGDIGLVYDGKTGTFEAISRMNLEFRFSVGIWAVLGALVITGPPLSIFANGLYVYRISGKRFYGGASNPVLNRVRQRMGLSSCYKKIRCRLFVVLIMGLCSPNSNSKISVNLNFNLIVDSNHNSNPHHNRNRNRYPISNPNPIPNNIILTLTVTLILTP